MTSTRTILTCFFISLFGFLGGCATTGSSTSAKTEPSLVIYDLSQEIDGQQYACKVMINQHAEKGGAGLLFLHGAGECGTDGVRQMHVGLPRYAQEQPELWPFVLIVPQKPSVNSEWENHDVALMKMLDQAAEMGLYDRQRLAITGLSQGGHGTIMVGGMHPDRFLAAGPVCGYTRTVFDGSRNRIPRIHAKADTPEVVAAAKKLSVMPVWLHHGDADSVVPADESRALHEALVQLDAEVTYSEYADVNHNSWDNAYTNERFSQWFIELLAE